MAGRSGPREEQRVGGELQQPPERELRRRYTEIVGSYGIRWFRHPGNRYRSVSSREPDLSVKCGAHPASDAALLFRA